MRIFLLAIVFGFAEAVKVLILAPDISNSQVLFNKRVSETLSKAGLDVTLVLIGTFDGRDGSDVKVGGGVKVKIVNASVGITMQQSEKQQGDIIYEDLSAFDSRMRNHFTRFLSILTKTCRNTLRNKEFMDWLKTEKFDVALVHMYHACPIGLVHYAGIKSWIWLNSGLLMDFVADSIGVPLIPSYVPPVMMTAHDTYGFVGRVKSFIGHGLSKFFWPHTVANVETSIFREELDPNFPSLTELARDCPLVMVNSNEMYDLPRPLLSKVVHVGGLGMQAKDMKPLPQNFDEIASKGKGVVIFSFGSVAPARHMPDEWKNALLSTFAKFPDYQFFMRYDGTDLQARAPANVHVIKWLPQADLLQDQRTKLIFTHGGYNSLQEAMIAGKPLIMVGLFGDQPKNAKLAEKRGIAVALTKGNFTKESIYEALQEVLTNPSYSSNARRLSDMVKKRPVTSEQLLVGWTKFLAEFKTLDNLVPAGQRLNFIEYHCIDVIAFLLLAILFTLYVIFSILKLVLRSVRKVFGGKLKSE